MIQFIINRPVLVIMFLAFGCLLGAVSYTQLPVENQPNVELPMLIVQIGSARDSDPAYVERHAIIPVESAIAGLEDIDRIESYLSRGRNVVFVFYQQNTDIRYAYLKLQQKIDELRPDLGQDFFVSVFKIDTEQLANQFMTLQARGESSLDQIRAVVDEQVTTELQNIDGIANVAVYGGRRRSVEVQLNDEALRALNMTPAQVASRISDGDRQRQYLGQAVDGGTEYAVNIEPDYTSIDNLGDIVIREAGPILLKHVATIMDGTQEEETISRVNGMESVSITLVRDLQTNLLTLSDETREIIDRINKKLEPTGVQLAIQTDAAEAVSENIDVIKMLALIGGLLAVVVLWVFLRNLPLVIVVAATIPISILISLNFFYIFDISINTFSLFGIAIAVGMLLDNSVVVLENVHRLIGRGRSVAEAVVRGTREVWRPVMAATMTTVAVFLPFVFSDNFLIRTLGRHIGVSIISTLTVSLIVAFLLIPVFSYRFLDSRWGRAAMAGQAFAKSGRMQQIYTLLLKACLRFPARTIIVAVVALFASVLLCLAFSVNVPDEIDTEEFSLYAVLPSGTTLISADEQAIEMDSRLADIAEIDERHANIEEEQIVFSISLKDDYSAIDDHSIDEIKSEIMDKLEGAFGRVDFSYEQPISDVRYRGGGGGGGGGFGARGFSRMLGIGESEERVVIRGSDLELLLTIADDIEYNLDNLETIRRTRVSIGQPQPSIDLLMDKAAMTYFDVSSGSLINELAAFQTQFTANATLLLNNEEVDIVIKSSDENEKSSDDLRELEMPSASGGSIPLAQLSRMVYTTANPGINRVNQEKEIEVVYSFEEEIEGSKELLDPARATVEQLVDDLVVPPGVSIEVIHDEMDLSDFYFLIAAAVILIYMILASVFESLVQPIAMMFTIPLATIGAFWGLILTGNTLFNANALIGFMILLGVIVNNGIILIDYSRMLQRRNFRTSRSLIAAGQARVRPILITAITSVLAMLPLAMGKAEYVSRIGSPFAITVIGGLTAGTLFTLLLIPTISMALQSSIEWWQRLNWKVRALQVALMAVGIYTVYNNVDSNLWRFANVTALLGIIPGMTFFMMKSLRRSSSTIIARDEKIRITVRNVVKNYDDHSRFAREWRKRERQDTHREAHGIRPKSGRMIDLIWILPLYTFMFYFTYLYLESGFWVMVLMILFQAVSILLTRRLLYNPTRPLLKAGRLRSSIWLLVFWVMPAGSLFWFFQSGGPLALVIILALFWYFGLLIYKTSRKLFEQSIEIARISGRFSRTRRAFYRFVKIIPLIGRRKKPFRALNQVSMEISSGMFGLVGPNGAGKTTLMRVICGILEQSRGTVTINDLNLNDNREELQSLIGYLPQEFGSYDNMTALQFLDYQALLKGLWDTDQRTEVVQRAIRSVHLDESSNKKIKAFSGGMKQRVGIAQTLLHLPRILVVDEPTAGLDPRERIRFRNLLSDLARDRVVIFSTHIIEDISSSCNRLAVLADGQVRFIGTPAEMVALTEGSVWQASVSEGQFEEARTRMKIVHHIRDGAMVRIRILSKQKPLEDSISVRPTLEDSYLWLLGHSKGDNGEQ